MAAADDAQSPPLDAEVAHRLSQRRLILTSSSGRSGTGYLAAILGLVPGLVSLHEPRPWLSDVLREVQRRPGLARRFLVEHKLPAMAAVEARLHAETSHLFCKGFLEPLLELGVRPDLVVLERPARQVASSLLRLGSIPGRSAQGLRWYLAPDDPGVLPLPGWQELADYQLCYWYCLESARRNAGYEALFRRLGARVARAEIAGVRTLTGFRRLLGELELPSPRLYDWLRLALNRYTRVNAKRDETANPGLPEDLEGLEREVEARVNEAGAGDPPHGRALIR